MALSPGTRLAHYEITAHVGSGGMGDVYQASDLKLGRSVAVKFLPDALACDAERVARFEREARVLASLNHPNIAAIHGMEDADHKKFLVMELVDGETLADRIRRGPLPLEEAFGIARQITDSLDAAHASGVVHRDLKPANIKVRADGTVKVLDFGLAKALDPVAGGRDFSPADHSPTITTPAMTIRGVILGTAAYMSPEQARGKAVDKRTDIFAFGCVLFEMLTGRRAFDGEDVADTLSRVIQRDPAWDLLPASVPPRIVDVLRLCLEKNLRTRRSDIADVRIDLDLALNAPVPAAATPSRRSSAGWMAAGVAVLLAGVLAIPAWRYFFGNTVTAVPAVRFLETAPDGRDLQPMVSVSPDGTMVAFVSGSPGSNTVWLRRLGSTEAVALEAASGLIAIDVFWSPDSRRLAFRAGPQLKSVDTATGATRVICDVAQAGPLGGTWSDDGTILLGGVTGLLRVPASGGTLAPLMLHDGAPPEALRSGPYFLPDGHHFLYSLHKDSLNPTVTIQVGDLRSGEATALLEANVWAQAATGFLLFIRASTLFAQPFDARSLQLSGAATPIGTAIPTRPSFSASQNGVLAIRAPSESRPPSDLAWIDRNGIGLGTLPKPPTGDYANPAISPDGKRVAVNSLDSRSGRNDIWVIDPARDVAERFTFGDGSSADPLWSPDGRQIAFLSERNGRLHIVAKETDGSGEQVLEDLGPGTLNFQGAISTLLSDWSPDGRFIAYVVGQGVERVYRLLSVADRKSSLLPLTAVNPYGLRFSRDGKWIAYSSRDSGRNEVFIRSFPALNRQHQISNSGGMHPRWGRNDREIFYSTDSVRVVSLTESGTDLIPGTPRLTYDRQMREPLDSRNHYAVTPDGERLLVRQPTGVSASALSAVQVLVNWPAMLQK